MGDVIDFQQHLEAKHPWKKAGIFAEGLDSVAASAAICPVLHHFVRTFEAMLANKERQQLELLRPLVVTTIANDDVMRERLRIMYARTIQLILSRFLLEVGSRSAIDAVFATTFEDAQRVVEEADIFAQERGETKWANLLTDLSSEPDPLAPYLSSQTVDDHIAYTTAALVVSVFGFQIYGVQRRYIVEALILVAIEMANAE